VPENASPGDYTIELGAVSDTHRINVESETVEVLPEDTPNPTTTPPPESNATPMTSGTPEPTLLGTASPTRT